MEVVEALLESNQPEVVDDLKKTISEQLSSIKESWLLSGLFDCYLQTSSMRLVEILVGVREPHDRYLFDKLSETLRGQWKLQALTLLGHVVRRHPTWLIKITQHQLLRDLLRLLKIETDTLLLMSALLVVIILLPMIPSLMGPFLPEIFEVFGRLAAWNTNNPHKVPEENLLHLQVGLCELFHRLYGMYPCNFLTFLRHQYSIPDNFDVFSHTIKPMVCSVRMHPLLVTASKDYETATTRWKRMEDHDIIVECAKYILDNTRDDTCPALMVSHRSRSAMDYSHVSEPSKNWMTPEMVLSIGKNERAVCERIGDLEVLWSPSVHCGLATPPPAPECTPSSSIPHTPISQGHTSHLSYQEGTSPPEAAIEATPETTPIKDTRSTRHAHISSAAVRALNTSLSSAGATLASGPSGHGGRWGPTCYSQPSSPMKKDQSPFRYPSMTVNVQTTNAATPPPVLSSLATPPPPVDGFSPVSAFQQPRRDSLLSGGVPPVESQRETVIVRKIERMIQDRRQVSSETNQLRIHSAGSAVGLGSGSGSGSGPQVPLSPLRLGSVPTPQSPVPMEPTAPVPGTRDWPVARPKAEKNGVCFEANNADHHNRSLVSPSPHTQNAPQPSDSTQEDQEVLEIVRQGEMYHIDTQPANSRQTDPQCQQQTPNQQGVSIHSTPGAPPPTQPQTRQCDSVLQEVPPNECVLEGDECQLEMSGSPCTLGGLHMPNSQSMYHFTQRVNRMRYYSQCTPTSSSHNLLPKGTISTGSSPGETGTFLHNNRVRRAYSCPEMEKSQPTHSADISLERPLDEKEEETEESSNCTVLSGSEMMVNGKSGHTTSVEMKSEGTQTMDCAPYEHLFLSVFPQLEQSSPAQSPAPVSNNAPISEWSLFPSKGTKFSPQAVLDRYLETLAINSHNHSRSASDEEVRLMREQLVLLHIELQFERQRRDVHAERNRRLLGKSRNNRALEEHKNALKEQLVLVQKDIENLNSELSRVRHEARQRENELKDSVNYWQLQCNRVQKNCSETKARCQKMEQELIQVTDKNNALSKDLQQVQAALFHARNEVQQASANAETTKELRKEVDSLQRKLLMSGESQQLCRTRIEQLAMACNRSEEISQLKESSREEIAALAQISDSRVSALEATKARVAELEAAVLKGDALITEHKKNLKLMKEEYEEKLQAVESRYRSQRSINERLEQHILELYKRAETAEEKYRSLKKKMSSSSCQNASEEAGKTTPVLPFHGDEIRVGVRDPLQLRNFQETVDPSERSGSSQSRPSKEDG